MTKIVVLDYGHGGKDSGAKNGRYLEKNINLPVGKVTKSELERHGIKVIETRKKDEFVSLKNRSNISDKTRADIFVSFHLNDFQDKTVSGLEVYHYPTSVNGKKLSSNIYNQLIKDKLYNKKRGVKGANFSVLRETKAPASLIELGFINNTNDLNLILNNSNKFGISIAKGILKYLNISYKVKNNKPNKNGYYRVVSGSYKAKYNADRQKTILKKKGFDSFLAYYEDLKVYRVIVGSYKNKNNALEQQAKLKAKNFDSFLAYYKE